MADIKIYELESDLEKLGVDVSRFLDQIEGQAKNAMQILHRQVYGFVVEEAESSLKSRRNIYLQNLGMMNESDNLWVVYLKKPAAWIENGMEPHNMIENLVKGPKAKTAKDGSRYNVIPFQYNKKPQESSRAHLQIQNLVKQELKKMGLDKPIMRNGQPAVGRVATLQNTLTGPGMPVSRHGRPLLQGLTIYQRVVQTASGKQKVVRDIMTFRVASTKQIGTGLWDHPGLKGAKIFDKVAKKVDEAWSKMINDIVSNTPIGRT